MAKLGFNRGLLDVNTQLRDLGLKTGIISNAEKPLRDILLDEYINKEPRQFDAVVCSCDVGYAKPDKEIFYITCKRLSVKPENTVFIDDVLAYVKAAKEIGMHGIHILLQKAILCL